MNFIKYNLVLLFVFYISIVSSVFESSFGNFTNEEIRAHARVVDYHASLIIGQANIALSGMAELIKRVDLTEDEAHELLGNTVDHLDGVRAIIFISEDGKLTFDSFSSPVPDVNLATRSYFIKAMEADEDHLIIDKPVAGKTSGIPFLPIARAVWKDGKPIGV